MDASFVAEHNDISRMCLKLAHNFVRVRKDTKPYSDNRDKKKLEKHKKHGCERNQNLKKNHKRQLNFNNNQGNNVLHNIRGETIKLFDDNVQQADRELFQELNQQFQEDSFRETQKNPNEDENMQLHLEVQVEPEFQNNDGKEQKTSERDIKLDLKIVFESEVEEDHQKQFDENTQVQLDKEKKIVGNQTKVKHCSKKRLQDIESEPKNKKHKLLKVQHCQNVEDNDEFKINEGDIEINGEEQMSKKRVEVKSTKSCEMLKKKIENKMKKSNIDIEQIKQGNFDLSVYQKVNEKFLNNLAVSFEQVMKPLEKRISDICSTYFPIECKLHQKCNDDIQTNTAEHKDGNKIFQQTLSGKTSVVSQVVDDKMKYTVSEDKIKVFEKDKKSELHDEKKKSNKDESLLNLNEEIETNYGVTEKKLEKSIEKVETEESFDLVILYNSDQKDKDEKTPHNLNVLQINYNEEIMKKFEEKYQQNIHENLDHLDQEADERIQFESKEQKQKFLKKKVKEDVSLQFRFFREEENISLASSIDSSISTTEENSSELLNYKLYNEEQVKLNKSSCIQELSQEDSDDSNVDVETFNDTADNLERKILKESNVNIEIFKEEISTSVSPVDSSICTNENFSNKLLKYELVNEEQIKLNVNGCAQELLLEDSDVDIETFSDTAENTERLIQTDTEVCIETFDKESTLSSNTSFDEEDYCNNFSKYVEINEVIEEVEEYDIVNEQKIVVGNHFPTDIQSLLTKQKKNENINKDSNVQYEYENALSKVEIKNLNNVETSSTIKNTQQLDEIPKEQIIKELHSQCNAFNDNMELEYKKERKLTNNRSSNHHQVLNEHQKNLLELKTNFQKTEQEFDHLQQKLSKKKLKKLDKKKPIEITDLPNQFHELKLGDENLQEELKEFEKDYNELKSEFQHSVQFEESNSNSIPKKEKPYSLFKQLFDIHDKKLLEFSKATTWPENCLYPSGLLDVLFADPNEIKPNVLLITLYPVDNGYTVKISLNINKPPIEMLFSYFNDSILCFVEEGKLPPVLLDLLDKAKPRLFYEGHVIAEVHDLINGQPGRIYRILLRPFYETVLYDVNKLVENNKQIDWTPFKILELERRLLLMSNPVICGDSSPIAGTTVLMQHQFTSCRSMSLNPLKNDFSTFESKSLNTDLFDECKTPGSMDILEDKNSILAQFGFHLNSSDIDIFTLILENSDPLKLSLLLCSSVKVKPVTIMKVETHFGLDKLNDLITVSLDILKEKISSDIEVIQACKYDDYPFCTLKFSPTLSDDNIHEITHANISRLVDKFMANVCINHLTIENYLENVLESEINPLNTKLVVNPESLSADTQNTGDTHLNLQTDHKIKKSIHFCSTKKMSKNSSKYLDLTNMKLGRNQIVESSSLKSETTLPLSVILHVDSLSPENSSKDTEKNSDANSSFTSSFLSNDSDINVVQKKLELLPIPQLTYVMSSIPCYLTSVSSTTSTMSLLENAFSNNNMSNNISFETSIIESSIPNNLQFQTSEQNLTTFNDYSTDTSLESVLAPTTEHLTHSVNIENPTIFVFEGVPTTSCDNLETEYSQINEETIQQINNLQLN